MGKREKVSISEMRDWLHRYELGDPIDKIAKEARRDIRTVLKYLDQARKDTALQIARQNLLTNALSKHNDDMLKVVTNIIRALEVPNAQVEIRQDEEGNWQDIQLTAAKGIQTSKGTRIEFQDEDSLIWKLLTEHLGVDSPLTRISAWTKALGEYLDKMKALNLQIVDLLKEKTGLDIIKYTYEKKPSIPILFQQIVDNLFPVFVNRATGILDRTDPEHNLKINGDGYLNGQLGWLSQDGALILDNIVQAISDIQQSREFQQIKSSYPHVQQITRKFRDEFEELSLLGFIAGRCRVCEKLGK